MWPSVPQCNSLGVKVVDDVIQGVEAIVAVDEGGDVLEPQCLEFRRGLGWVCGDHLHNEMGTT